jgi:predicted  nucleic acid-binding Zn-ribbon protein
MTNVLTNVLQAAARSQAEKRVAELAGEVADVESRLQQTVAELRTAQEKSQLEKAAWEAEYQKLQTESAGLQTQVNTMGSEVQIAWGKHERGPRRQLGALRKRCSIRWHTDHGSGAADEREIKRLKGELGALTSDYNAAEKKLSATLSDLLKKDQQLQAAEEQLQAVKLHMADLAAKVDALANQANEMAQQKEVLAATVQELQGAQVCHHISIGCCGPLEQKLSVGTQSCRLWPCSCSSQVIVTWGCLFPDEQITPVA